MNSTELLNRLGVPSEAYQGGDLEVRTPIDGSTIAHLVQSSPAAVDDTIGRLRPSP